MDKSGKARKSLTIDLDVKVDATELEDLEKRVDRLNRAIADAKYGVRSVGVYRAATDEELRFAAKKDAAEDEADLRKVRLHAAGSLLEAIGRYRDENRGSMDLCKLAAIADVGRAIAELTRA